MASESPREHPPMVLLAGSVPCPLEAEADRAAEAGWRFSQAPDVYAAAARLLRTDRPRPDAVLVLVESLRGDELRFFDLLARRWPDLPVAAVYCVCAEDRRLEACRLRHVTVLAAKGFADWLIARHPAMPNPPEPSASAGDSAGSPADPPTPDGSRDPSGATDSSSANAGASAFGSPPPAAQGACTANAADSLPVNAISKAPEGPTSDPVGSAGHDVVLDLPDEWADLPDPEDSEAEPAAEQEYDAEDLPEESDESDDSEGQELDHQGEDILPEEPDEDEEGGEPNETEDLPERVPLTPWSDVPRPQRRRPGRVPPHGSGPGQSPPAEPSPSPASSDGATEASAPAMRNPPAARPGGWEHGLLTPEELRALLQEPDDPAGPQEAQS